MTKRRPAQRKFKSRKAVAVAQALDQASTTPLEQPSGDALTRFSAIPLLFDAKPRGRVLPGMVAYDSWAQAGIGLRDVTDGHVRRLQFTAGNIQFELVAERRANTWEFIGRVYTDDAVTHDFVLAVGTRKMLPSADGFFHWSSDQVMRRLRLISLRRTVAIEGISW